jgi:pyruvate ferredoxin oxidoreductase gamma subunit
MKSDVTHETVWLGRGGQGAFTAARLLGLSAVRFNSQHALAFPSFGPERRGAPVFAYTRICAAPIADRSPVFQASAFVVLDESLLDQVATPFVHATTLLVVNSSVSSVTGQVHRIEARRIAHEFLGSEHINTILLGYLIGVTGLLPTATVEAAIQADFGPGTRAQKNILACRHAVGLGKAAQVLQHIALT